MHRTVVLDVERLDRVGRWAFVMGTMRSPGGERPDYAGTPYAARAATGGMSDTYVALLRIDASEADVPQDVADHAADGSRDGAHDDAYPEREAEGDTFRDADDGKKAEAEGVEEEEGAAESEEPFLKNEGGEEGDGGGCEVLGVEDPEGGDIHEEVARGAAADGCDEADDVSAKPVDLFAGGHADAADCKCEGAEEVEEGGELRLHDAFFLFREKSS